MVKVNLCYILCTVLLHHYILYVCIIYTTVLYILEDYPVAGSKFCGKIRWQECTTLGCTTLHLHNITLQTHYTTLHHKNTPPHTHTTLLTTHNTLPITCTQTPPPTFGPHMYGDIMAQTGNLYCNGIVQYSKYLIVM